MPTLKITIIGGGFSGAMTAYHLLRQDKVACAVTIVEPALNNKGAGLGLAYSTTCGEHLLNVSAAGMSALANQPHHFLNYARAKNPAVKAEDFLPRMFFGQYVQELLNTAIADSSSKVGKNKCQLTLVKQQAVDIEPTESLKNKPKYQVILDDQQSLESDIVVLALGNLAGKRPEWLDRLAITSSHYIHNPWNTKALAAIAKTESILLVGTGLTAVDKVIELKARGHVGKITAVSRHGLLPRHHLDLPELHPAQLAWEEIHQLTHSALTTLKLVREKTAQAVNWQAGIDSFRSVTQRWWGALALGEKRNFMRHLQTYWDIHRHRMAPSIAAKIDFYQKSGELVVLSGGIRAMKETEADKNSAKVEVAIQERRSEPQTLLFDKVVNCTGPQLKLKAIDSPLMANLHRRGLIAPDQTGAGINCQPCGKVIDSSGKSNNQLYAIGPLLKAVLLESVAVPELKGQAEELAQLICTEQQAIV